QKMLVDSRIAPSSIAAIGTSAIGPCMLPVDRDGAPLMNGVLYGIDTRAAEEIKLLTDRIGAETIVEKCGNALTSQSVGPKVFWLKRNRPELFARAHKILTSTSYLVHRLTGRFVIDHYSAANTSPLYLPDRLAYSSDLANDIIALDNLPEPAWTTDIAGGVTQRAAEQTGLAAGTPVIVGTIDAAAEALSVGVAKPGDMMLMYGSTIFIIEITHKRVADSRLWYAPWLFPGQHASMSGLATSGTLTHWFRQQFARELDPETAIVALTQEAEKSPPGAKGLIVLPYFSGERTPIHDPQAKGVTFGLNLTHERGDLFRALLEGIACGTRHIFETYADVGQEPAKIYAVGGGTKNRVWAQATSDISAKSQIVREKTIGASYGDAFLAAMAVGDAKATDIEQWNPVATTFAPDPTLHERYDKLYRIYRDLYPATRAGMAALDSI
ncbi:MAG TPA: FGGY-family carbohydrate kinase, partial [Dongiaceae bacterium]|nr:FGGY-family carbohydrate kinase [Dongiaceae bacterium]